MIRDPKDLPRYNAAERANHWVTGICFILLALSGLAFFHPAFYPLVQLFGGGAWARIIHPYLGVILGIAFVVMFFRFWQLNLINDADREWLTRVGEMIEGNDHNMPEQGKYNAGQKMVFWSMAVCVSALVISGLLMWRAYFNFPVGIVRLAAVVHAAAATIMILVAIVHVYAAIWTKGTIRAMWYGTVTRAWAKQHHRAWYRQMTGK
ncbi:formate dehydrogenase subunit gamma [Propionivibrio dicarboxylicus]|uniref:Formate dehydrogenase subunit gamma n=1 Tax=Propionivibrio dicarboxylicus TaxID=83767 RepID=A0A1G8GDF8_9RHOO|nr:formate dehydrogenase subunit gamma [Propionivibrio dicarboxylicus]SDH92386.1 formate dehydrogenase subunit gamma [Propionivibrio dicarboxylicus]